SDHKKKRSVTDTRQNGDAGIGQQLRQSGAIHKESHAGGIEVWEEKQKHGSHSQAGEQNYESHKSRNVFAGHQNIAPHGGKEVVMPTAIDYDPTKTVHDTPRTAEKHERAYN